MDNEMVPNSFRRNSDEVKNEMEKDHPSWKIWKKRRYVLAILAFLGFFNAFTFRTTLNITIVAMTKNETVQSDDGNITYKQEFNWDSKMQGHLLSSFYYGYLSTQLFGGWLSARIGGKWVFGVGIGATGLLSLLTPVAAKQNFYLLLAVRIVGGIFEGVTFPCMHAMWAKWAPPFERSQLASISVSGCFVGTVVSMALSGYLCDVVGWESPFYVFGILGIIWFCVWWLLVANSPSKDSKITKAELNYIKESFGDTNDHSGPIKHPWKSIFTSIPVWAIVLVHFSEAWGFFTLLTQLPKYIEDISHLQLKQTGVLSAIPYLVLSITSLFAGYLVDWFQLKGILTTTQIRKVCICCTLVVQIVFILTGTYLASPIWTTVCVTLALGSNAFLWVAFAMNYLDVAPQHGSVLMGIGHTVSAISGFVSPIIAGYVVTTPTAAEWQIIFWIACGIHLVSCVIYGIFGTAELQPWAIESSRTNSTTENKYVQSNGNDNLSFTAN